MNIKFSNVIPNPLINESFDEQSSWGKELSLDCSKNYLVTSNSGKGKSSFISFLFGSRIDYVGEVMVDNQNWKTASLDFKSNTRTNDFSILPQDMRLFYQLTSLQNLEIQNDLHKKFTNSQLKDKLIEFGLEGQINQKCKTLSLGQQQRVGIIRSLIRPFKFLVLDEPFSHLDESNIQKGVQLIQQACSENKAGFIMASLGSKYGMDFNKIIYL